MRAKPSIRAVRLGVSVEVSSEFNGFIARMYESVFHLTLAEFKERTLASVTALVPFTSGIWASGVHSSNTIFSVAAFNYPAERMLEYAFNWQNDDFVRAAAVAKPGTSVRIEDLMPLDAYYRTDIYRKFSGPSGIEHSLGTASADPITTVGELVFLFRDNKQVTFSDDECVLMQFLTPHLVSAWRHSQMVNLAQSEGKAREAMAAMPSGHAVVDDSGFIQSSDDDFSQRVRASFPEWSGPVLPELIRAILSGERDHCIHNGQKFALVRGVDRHIVTVSIVNERGAITPAEHRTVCLFVAGQTSGQIAVALDLSPATVRNQIASAYRKLGVHSKVELLRAFGSIEP